MLGNCSPVVSEQMSLSWKVCLCNWTLSLAVSSAKQRYKQPLPGYILEEKLHLTSYYQSETLEKDRNQYTF